jgi:copper chaperone CopZ
MLLKDCSVRLEFSLFSLLSNISNNNNSEKNWEQSLGKNLKQALCSDGDIKEILSKLRNLYGVKEVEMMMVKHTKNLEVKKKIKEMKKLINKIFNEPKEKEKLESLMKVLEKIP